MWFRLLAVLGLALALSIGVSAAQKKKKKSKKDEEPITQTLAVVQDPPAAVTAESARLSFRVAPLSGKGLLTQQIRDGLKALVSAHRGDTIIKIRAFVAGTGDMRRVREIVSETFAERRVSLPAVTTIQAGALPLEGAQVVLESIAMEKKAVNPHGIAILQSMTVEQVQAALTSIGLPGMRVLRATCYLQSLEGYAEARATVRAAFPSAAINILQMQRLPSRAPLNCEVVAALAETPAGVEFKDGSRMVLIPPAKLVITSTQLAFHDQDKDIRLAFERLGKTLDGMHVGFPDVVAANVYPLAQDVAAKVRGVQVEFFAKQRPPVVSSFLMEGLPSLDSSFGLEAVAVAK